MSEVRYTLVEGPGKGREYPTAATQYFHSLGGKFAYLSAGSLTLCGSANRPFGWIESQKNTSGKNSWVSAATDEVFCYYADDNNGFEIPALETAASLAASQIGLSFNLVTRSATHAMIQYALVGNTTASPLSVIDVDTDNHTVRVKVGPHFRQK